MRQPSLPAVIGPTENALRALLRHVLASTSIDSYEEWVAMNLASRKVDDLRAGLADDLKVTEARVDEVLTGLTERGLLAADGSILTDDGREALDGARDLVATATANVLEGIDDADVEVATRVLAAARRAAETALAT